VEAPGRVVVEEVTDRAAVDVGMRRVGGQLSGPSEEALHGRPHRRDRLGLGELPIEHAGDCSR
jgi:hypothetical protein